MGDSLHAEEKFSNAVYLMATGRGNVKARLLQAFIEFCPVSTSDLPKHLQDEYESIRQELTKKPAKQRAVIEGKIVRGVEGRIGAALATMRNEKAEDLARRIYDLWLKLSEANAAV